MVCPGKLAGLITGSIIGIPLLLLLPMLAMLHVREKREARKLQLHPDSNKVEQKTVVVENRGSVGGQSGVAEVVTTGPSGTAVQSLPTNAAGSAVVSTSAAGIPGGTTTVAPGETKVVTSEHPVGQPEKAVITSH